MSFIVSYANEKYAIQKQKQPPMLVFVAHHATSFDIIKKSTRTLKAS